MCAKAVWTILYRFIQLQNFARQATVMGSAGASSLHIWVQSPHWKMGKDAPLIFILTRLVHTSNFTQHFQWYINERLKNCRLPTVIHFILLCYVLKSVLKWQTFTAAFVHPPTTIQVSQEGKTTKRSMELSPQPKLFTNHNYQTQSHQG
jgi:hypothetical protein